jgi:hypothetical protein
MARDGSRIGHLCNENTVCALLQCDSRHDFAPHQFSNDEALFRDPIHGMRVARVIATVIRAQ